MIRRPPRSTLFPYRRSSDLGGTLRVRSCRSADSRSRSAAVPAADLRSEEHTSELQSHVNLVCRLLLEKKKKNRHRRAADIGNTPSCHMTIRRTRATIEPAQY